jgi:hypothetical protein
MQSTMRRDRLRGKVEGAELDSVCLRNTRMCFVCVQTPSLGGYCDPSRLEDTSGAPNFVITTYICIYIPQVPRTCKHAASVFVQAIRSPVEDGGGFWAARPPSVAERSATR